MWSTQRDPNRRPSPRPATPEERPDGTTWDNADDADYAQVERIAEMSRELYRRGLPTTHVDLETFDLDRDQAAQLERQFEVRLGPDGLGRSTNTWQRRPSSWPGCARAFGYCLKNRGVVAYTSGHPFR